MKLLWQLSVRTILRHRRRNFMLLLAIAVAVAGVCASNTIIRGMQHGMLESAVENLTGHVMINAPGYRADPGIAQGFRLSDEGVPDLGAYDMLGWAARIRIPAVIMSERETRGIQLVGVDPGDESISFLDDVQIEGRGLRDASDGSILIGAELARQLETRIGRRLVLITQGADGLNREKGYRVVGTYDADGTGLEKAFAFTGLASLQDLLDTEAVTELSVRLREEPGARGANLKQMLMAAFSGLEVRDWRELEPQAAAMYLMADTMILIWFLVMMSALTFGLVNTLVASVMERVRELGMLRALGMQRRVVLAQVVLESTLIMTAGVIIGMALGYLGFLGISDGIDLSGFADGMEMAGMQSVLQPVLQVSDFALVAGMSLVLGILASLYPAWRAVKIQPLEAMRG